jgi:hypothetical protein
VYSWISWQTGFRFSGPLTIDARRGISCAKDRKAKVNFGNQRFASRERTFSLPADEQKLLAVLTPAPFNQDMKFAKLLSLVLLAVLSAPATDFPTTYQQAVALADAQEKAPATREYMNHTLMPYYEQKYGPVFQSCFKTVQQPQSAPFSFVAAIGADGRLIRIFEEHPTTISQCLLDNFRTDTFPTPPESPYYFHVEMKFTDAPEPAHNGSSAAAPPLVLASNDYSYTFGVPAGWQFSFEQARQRGATLAFFPKGGSFADSSSVIYVNEVENDCTDTCVSPVTEAIAKTLREIREDDASVQVATAPAIQTKDGTRASIRTLKGSRDPRNPDLKDNEALAFIAHDETVILVVLTARDMKTWEQDYAAFQQIVAGHKFFTCNSPDLAIPCQHPASSTSDTDSVSPQ